MNKIKACIIGLGRIGSILEEDELREKPCTHAGSFAENPDCELAAGCDTDEEKRNLFNEKWKVPVYDDAAQMLKIHQPQIVSVATHPDSHYHYCRLASEFKIPVVICEKPLADNLAAARKIAHLAEKNESGKTGTKIIINHERRYSLDYIRTKTILQEETLGKILSVRAVLYMGKSKRLIDVLWHDGTHLVDIIMFLTDGVLKHRRSWGAKLTAQQGTAWLEGEIKPQSTQSSTEEEKSFKLKTPRNSSSSVVKKIPVIMEIGAGRDHLVFETEFSCEKGRLRIGNRVFEIFESVVSPYAKNFKSLKNTGETFNGDTGYFKNMIKDAVACVKEPNLKPASDVTDGLRVIEYLNSIRHWH